MAITEGRYGRVTVVTTAAAGEKTVAELGEWRVSGISRDMVDVTVFGNTVKRMRPATINAGQITFSGFYDPTDSTGQARLIAALSSGKYIGNATLNLKKMRLWNSDTTSAGSTGVYGFWSCSGSSGRVYITSKDVGTDKNGVGTISFTGQVSDGLLAWATAT